MGVGLNSQRMKHVTSIVLVCSAIVLVDSRQSCPDVFSKSCVGEDYYHAAAHGIHSLTLQELQYFFDESATENNSIPMVNFDLSSPQLTLPSVPDLKLNNSFLTPSMNSVDHILSNWENTNFFMSQASVLEMLVHNLHMYETLSVSGKIYAKIKRKSKKNKNKMKKLCKCMEESEDSVIENLERAARFFRTSMGPESWRRRDYRWKEKPMLAAAAMRSKQQQQCENLVSSLTPRSYSPGIGSLDEVPSLENSTIWNEWKPQMTVPLGPQWNYELANYIFCKLNMDKQ